MHPNSTPALFLRPAHAALGVRRPLILSYDGGGNDGVMLAFAGNVDKSVTPISRLPNVQQLEIGNLYTGIGLALPEVNRRNCSMSDKARGYCVFDRGVESTNFIGTEEW